MSDETVNLSAEVAQRAGCLPGYPRQAVFLNEPVVLLSVVDGWVLVYVPSEGYEEQHPVSVVGIPLTPDTLSAACRAMAAKLGHTGAQCYWLARGTLDGPLVWKLLTWDLIMDDPHIVEAWPTLDADTPAEAAKAIIARWAEEAE